MKKSTIKLGLILLLFSAGCTGNSSPANVNKPKVNTETGTNINKSIPTGKDFSGQDLNKNVAA